MLRLATALLTLPLPAAAPHVPPDDDIVVTGRVVDAGGAPVAGARVALAPHAGRPPWDIVSADADGRFRLVGHAPGDAILRAWSSGRGCASIALHLETSRLESLSLTLQGPGELSGIVLDASGAPVAETIITAVRELTGIPESVKRVCESKPFGGDRGDWYELDDDGLGWDSVQTAADGTFSFRGLARGVYWLHARHPFPILLIDASSGPHATGAQGIELRLLKQRLELRALDDSGVSLPPGSLRLGAASEAANAMEYPLYMWAMMRPLPFVPECLEGQALADGSTRFFVDPETEYRLVCVSPRHAFACSLTSSSESEYRAIPVGGGSQGEVEIHIEDDSGQPYRDFKQAWIYGATQGALLRRITPEELGPAPWLVSLPAGDHVLALATTIPGPSCDPDQVPPRDRVNPLLVPFVVTDGERHELRVSPAIGGTLRLELAWPPGERFERLARLLELDQDEPVSQAARIAWGSARNFVALDGFAGTFSRRTMRFCDARGTLQVPVPGRAYTSPPLSAGRHCIRLQLPGFREVSATIEIRDGEETPLRIELEAAP